MASVAQDAHEFVNTQGKRGGGDAAAYVAEEFEFFGKPRYEQVSINAILRRI